MLKVFFSNFMREKKNMPLVHELKFGAINQLSRYLSIQMYTHSFTKSFYIKGGLYPLICCTFSKIGIKHKSKHNKIEISLFNFFCYFIIYSTLQ